MNAKDLLRTRGRRAVATMLTYMEEHVWPEIPKEQRDEIQAQARAKILAIMGDYQDLAMDMVSSETGAINEYWVDELAKLHDEIGRLHGQPALSDRR